MIFGPNITGNTPVCNAWSGPASVGALYKSGGCQSAGGGAANGTVLYFDASKASSIYKEDATTVQTSSNQNLIIIKF